MATPAPLLRPLEQPSNIAKIASGNAPLLAEDVARHPGDYAHRAASGALGAVRPIGIAQQIGRGRPLWQELLSQVGVTFPRDLPSGYRLRAMSNGRMAWNSLVLDDYASGHVSQGQERINEWNRAVQQAWAADQQARGGNVSGRAARAELNRLLLKPPTLQEVLRYRREQSERASSQHQGRTAVRG